MVSKLKNAKTGMLLMSVLALAGCAGQAVKHRYAEMTPADVMAKSHITPSDSEKLLLRQHLADHYPQSAEGMYAKAYMAYKNGNSDLEKELSGKMLKAYPESADINHYQIFMGDLDDQLKAVRKGIAEHADFLSHNFVIALADKYIENTKKLKIKDFIKEIDALEKKSGPDVYVYDYVRGMVERSINKDNGKAVAYYASALEKKGALARTSLWKDYFKYKYTDLYKEKEKKAYIAEVNKSVEKVQKSKLSQLEKSVISHNLYKQLAEKMQDESRYLSNKFFEKANSYYFTIEAISAIRTNYIRQKREGKIKYLLESAVKKLPNNPDANGLLGLEYADVYEYEKAREYYKKAIKYSVTDADKRHYVSNYSRKVLFPMYKPLEAERLIEKYSKESNDRSEKMLKLRAEAFYYAGKPDMAKDVLEDITTGIDKDSWSRSIKSAHALLDDYIKRSRVEKNTKQIKSKVKDKNPTVLATTAVNADWVAMSPDGKHFLGSDESSDYMLWDAEGLNVIDVFNDVILNHDYVKYMTKPVYSPDGRYIAYVSEFKDDKGHVALIYDLKERRFSHQLPMIKKTSAIAWSADSTEIVIWNYGRLIKYSLGDKEIIAQGAVLGQDGADIMKWTADGKYLALLERSARGSIRIYDAETLNQLHRLDQVSWAHALGVSKDGRYIFSADNRYKLHRWDTANNFEHKEIKIPVLGRLIKPHPIKKEILINDWSDTNKLLTVDYEKFEVTNTQPTGSAELRIHYIGDGKKILAVNVEDDQYEIYDSSTLKLIETYKGQSAVVNGGAYANTALNQLVVWDQEGLNVWSVETGKKVHQWKGEFKSVMKDSTNMNLLYAIVEDKESKILGLKKYDLRDFKSTFMKTLNIKVDVWGVQGDNIILAGHGKAFYSRDVPLEGVVKIVNTKSNKTKSISVPFMTRPLTRLERYGRGVFSLKKANFKHVAVSADMKHVALNTIWSVRWKGSVEESEFTRVFNIETGKEINRIKKVGALLFKNNNELAVSNNGKVKKGVPVYSVKTGQRVGLLEEGFNESVVTAHKDWKSEVEFESRNLKVEVGNSNRMLFKNRSNEKQVLTIVAKRKNEWIAYLPGGEYTASENGDQKVSWRVGNTVLQAEEVKMKYKKEDIIKQTLRYTISDR